MNYDLVLKNINYLDVNSHSFKKGDIAIKDGYIKEVSNNLTGTIEKDCTNKYLVPGFIDSHIHLESSIINPVDFAKMVAPHGTTAVVTDPHEIANVCGRDGIKWMIEKTKNLPMGPHEIDWTRFDGDVVLENIKFSMFFRSQIEMEFLKALVPVELEETNEIKM